MKQRHIQTKVSEEEFISIKKRALDLGATVEKFIKETVLKSIREEILSSERNKT